jgi:hypothetical protein
MSTTMRPAKERRPGDHDREHDRIGYDLEKYSQAIATQAENLRNAIWKAHLEGWSDLAIADRTQTTIHYVQRTITRLEALEEEVFHSHG